MASFFVSHSSADRDAVERLTARLRVAGFDALFIDYDPALGIPAGRNWERELYSELQRTDAVLFVATDAAIKSRWCFAELALARSARKPVFAIRVSGKERHPLLTDVQWIDAAEGDAAFQHLFAAMNEHGFDPQDSFKWDPKRSPYPGLEAFTADDAAVFFGRRDAIDTAVRRLHEGPASLRGLSRRPFLAVVGPSGSGKSSLVRAGVAPRLARSRQRWVTTEPFSPERNSISALARTLALALDGRVARRSELEQRLRRDPREFLELAKDITASREGRPPSILLVMDRAEDLLWQTREERGLLLRLLGQTSEDSATVSTLVLLRSESLSAFTRDPDLVQLIEDPLVLGTLGASHVAEVIEGPAKRAGLQFAPGLVARMAEDMRGGDALALLSYTLQQLYLQRTPEGLITAESYERLGGVDGALRGRADVLNEHLAATEGPDVVLAALLHLVTVGERDEPIRRKAPWSDFDARQLRIIRAFVEERLVVSDGDHVELAHETLIRAWPPLRAAVEASREELRTAAELSRLARDWAAAGKRDSYLIQGERLQRAKQWLELHDGPQASLLKEFLEIASNRDRATLAREGELLAKRILSDIHQDPERGILLAVAAVEEYAPSAKAHLALSATLTESRVRGYLQGPGGAVSAVAYIPDGRKIATGSQDGTVRIWDAGTRAELLVLAGHASKVRSLSFSPDGASLLSASEDGTARVWNVVDGKQRLLVTTSFNRPCYGAAFAPSGDRFATLASNDDVMVWHSATGQKLQSWAPKAPTAPLMTHGLKAAKGSTIAYSGDGRLIVVGSDFPQTAILKVTKSNLRLLRTLQGLGEGCVHSAAFSADGTRVATGSGDGSVFVWQVSDGQCIEEMPKRNGPIFSVKFSPRGDRIVTAGADGRACIWDTQTRTLIGELGGHTFWIRDVAFSPDAKAIVTASEDGTARIWDATRTNGRTTIAEAAPLCSALFSRDGRRVVTAASDGAVRIWDAVTGEGVLTLASPRGYKTNFARFSPDGSRVLSVGDDQMAYMWDARDGRLLFDMMGHDAPVLFGAFSRDGSLLATSSQGEWGTVRLWDAETGGHMNTFCNPDDGSVRSVEFSPDGSRLVAAAGKTTARVWDIATGKEVLTLKGHNTIVQHAQFSPDGTRIATGSLDQTVRIWDVRDGRELLGRGGFAEGVHAVAFSPDGMRLATVTEGGTAQILDSVTGEKLSVFHLRSALAWIDYVFDGTRVITAGRDGLAVISEDLPLPRLLERARERTYRELSPAERREFNLPDLKSS
jgi:WD40 repeat protein